MIEWQEDEKDKDTELAKKVHNVLNNITTTEDKPASETEGSGVPAPSGPSMNS